MYSLMLVVSLLTGLHKNHSTDFHKIQCKVGTWAPEENVYFCLCNSVKSNSHFSCHDNNTSNHYNYSTDDYKR